MALATLAMPGSGAGVGTGMATGEATGLATPSSPPGSVMRVDLDPHRHCALLASDAPVMDADAVRSHAPDGWSLWAVVLAGDAKSPVAADCWCAGIASQGSIPTVGPANVIAM